MSAGLVTEELSEWTERVRSAHRAVTLRLRGISDDELAGLRIDEADVRIGEYIRDVRDNPEKHCTWDALAVERFVIMSRRYSVNVREVQRFVTFYEMLYFPGRRGMQRYKLTRVQAFQFASIFAFWDGARRIVREAVLFVPRKFSKTTSTASLAVYDLLYGDNNAEAYVGANSQDQAKKCFDVIRGCVRRLDPRGRRYVVNEEAIKSRRADRTAMAQCLTANARTKDGLNASLVIMDEFSQARDNTLLSVLTTSMGTRLNRLTVIITTASDVFEGPFYSRLQGYKRLLLGDYEDDSVFAHLFEPDPDDAEDDPATWLKVNPHIGITVVPDYYESKYKDAVRGGADEMLAFRTKLLNIYVEDERRAWLSATTIRAISKPFGIESFVGRPDGVAAYDLSVRGDFSAVSVGVYIRAERRFYYHTAYFFPRGGLSGHPNEELYRKWAQAGWLILLDGEVMDYSKIAEYIHRVNRFVRLLSIGYDAYKAQDTTNILVSTGAGNVLRSVSQTHGNFNAACDSLEHSILTGAAVVDDNPITAYCFGNAVMMTDRNNNRKPYKRTERGKIDGVITILMCQRQFLDIER